MLVVHHPDQALHDPEHVFRLGQFLPQPDRAERYHVFLAEARKHAGSVVEAPLGSLQPILDVHDAEYIEFLQSVWRRWRAVPGAGAWVIPSVHPTHRMRHRPKDLLGELGWYSNSTSCPIGEHSFASAFASAHCAIHGSDRLAAASDGGVIYALCRPPGHHAYRDLMSGVCFINNAAVAAHRLAGRLGKVAILDIDVHHGNGTQDIFYADPGVLTVDIHAHPERQYPYFAGYAEERGAGPGLGFHHNFPLPYKTDDARYLATLAAGLAEIRAFAPRWLVISFGADIYAGDPIGDLAVTTPGFAAIGAAIAALGLPALIVMEGGYNTGQLGVNTVNFLTPFAGG